jgi:hypothetical protein
MNKLIYLSFFALKLFVFSVDVSTFCGTAYDEKKNILFKEEYKIESEKDKILNVSTKFFCPKGELLAEMHSDFSKNSFVPHVKFSKKDFDYGAKLFEQGIELFKKTLLSEKKTKTLSLKENMVTGHGFYFYILSKLDSLLKGEKSQMVFIQPNRLGAYTFNMKAKKISDENVKVELVIDSAILRKFVPDIELIINQKTNSLVSYKGLSGFFSDDKSLKNISVSYTTPQVLKGPEKQDSLPSQDAQGDLSLKSHASSHAP